ncbi:MAG: trypsin-like peptidase domain-containing protein [Gaiellaceae bacterium]
MSKRIVEIEAHLGEGGWRYGSGLVIGDRTVLTAAHVVLGVAEVKVRGPDKHPLKAVVEPEWVGDPDRFDLALLEVNDLADDFPHLRVVVVDRDVTSGEHVEAWSVGYPRFQVTDRDGDGRLMRDTAEVRGSIPPLSDLASRFLSLKVENPPRDLPPQKKTLAETQWSGMSGAAVLSGDSLIGVVSEHAERRGPSDITVTPLDFLSDPDRQPANASEWWARLGVSNPSSLTRVPVAVPVEETADRRVVGSPPVGSLELWQDRDGLRHDLKELLMKGEHIISVVGRRGVGKSGVVTKVLADFEEPEDGDTAGIDGIVYMSTRTGSGEMTLASIFHQIVKLLPESEQVRLSNRWASGGEATLDDLFDSLRARRVVVVLDNLDDLQEPETGEFRTLDVPTFLTAVARAPRAPQVMTTSRQRLVLPLDVQQHVTERELQDGLEPEYGAALLRELDKNRQLEELDDAELRALSDRVGGVPRGLQLLVGYVRDHRVSGVRKLIRSTSAPDVVLKELVSTTYDGLVGAAREVLDVVAVAGVPLPPDAIIELCEDQSPDEVEGVLDDLVNRCSLVLGDDGLVRLHPLDTDYVQSKLEHDRFVAFDLRLAGWYAGRSSDRSAWRRLTDADPVKQEYRHRWRAGQRPEALDVLAGAVDFLGRHGDSPVLRAAVAAADQAGLDGSASRHVCLGAAEFYSGSLETAAECFRTASRLAGGAPEWDVWTGVALRQTGHGREAAEVLSPVASDDRNSRPLRLEAALELVLAWCYAGRLDDAAAALSQLEALIGPDDSALNRAYVANASALLHLMAGLLPEAVSAAEDGIAAYADTPHSPTAAYVQNTRGLALLLMGRAADAAADFSAVATTGAAVGQDRLEGIALANSAWASLHLGAWESAATAAQQALERLTSSSGDVAAPRALIELVTATEEEDIEQLLRRLADRTDVNPDFYRPPPHAIKELASGLAAR